MAKLFSSVVGIIGETGSGKSTFYNTVYNSQYLINKYNLGYAPIITTRQLRSNENHKEYKQVSKKQFEKLIDGNKLLNYTSFDRIDGRVYYGHLKSDFNLEEKNYILILDIERAMQTQCYFKDLGLIEIWKDDFRRLTTLFDRDDATSIKEKIRRVKADREKSLKYKDIVESFPLRKFYRNCLNIKDIEQILSATSTVYGGKELQYK